MKKSLRAVISIVLAFTIFLSFAACSSDDGKKDANIIDQAVNADNESSYTTESTPDPTAQPTATPTPFVFKEVNEITKGNLFTEAFRRGVNMGNMLESPNEGEWGVTFKPEFFTLIKSKGFDFVRLPVKWSNHLKLSAEDGGIAVVESFMKRVTYIVEEALNNDLGVIINIHHYDEMNSEPEKNIGNLLDIWHIIAEKYKDYPQNVVFEVLNEPNTQLTTKVWNGYQNECIKVIRETNPTRKIVVSGGDWGGYSGIFDLVLPKDDNLILSFHYYDPFNFTHQGADWSGDMEKYLGTQWTASDTEIRNIESTFKNVKAWSESTGIPILLGEFGAYEKADMDSRVKWTACMRELAEKYGFAWSYWEFCSGFGIYNQSIKEFKDGLTNALTGVPQDSYYGTGKGAVLVTYEETDGYIGPFKADRAINLICDSWTGMSKYDTDNNTQIVEFGETTADWAQVYIVLDDLNDTGSGFSKETCELTIRNIDGSITDFCINLDNNGPTETQLSWMNESTIKGNSSTVIQNKDGTTTFILDLKKAYNALKGKCENGIRLKMFIESVPDRKSGYDQKGSVEFINAVLK